MGFLVRFGVPPGPTMRSCLGGVWVPNFVEFTLVYTKNIYYREFHQKKTTA